jgi:hypothetical protein
MRGTQGRTYDVAADGRFLVVKRLGQDVAPTQVMLVKNWFEELRRLAPMN